MLLDHHAEDRCARARSQTTSPRRADTSQRQQSPRTWSGSSAAQRKLVPALCIPIMDVHGELAFCQIRPDSPRATKGRIRKYEMPFGAHMALDVPPAARGRLGDPKVPLVITEGVRKADSAISAGMCAIDLVGVWNWRGRNGDGGLTALADWEHIALNGRDIFLAFDSDAMTKREVHAALEWLWRLPPIVERTCASSTCRAVTAPSKPAWTTTWQKATAAMTCWHSPSTSCGRSPPTRAPHRSRSRRCRHQRQDPARRARDFPGPVRRLAERACAPGVGAVRPALLGH